MDGSKNKRGLSSVVYFNGSNRQEFFINKYNLRYFPYAVVGRS